MKKLPIAVGLILIAVGLILISGYNLSVTSKSWETKSEINGKWAIAGNFNLGENITLFVTWSAITYGEELGELPANVSIIANNRDTTEFQVYFLQNPNSPPGQEAGRQQVYVSRIELLYNDGSSLKVDNPPKQIGGIVMQAGTFEARVHPPPDSFPWAGYPEPQPPDALRLLRVVTNMGYPYRSLLPLGAIVSVFGGVVLVWTARTDRKATRIRKLRARKLRKSWFWLWLS